MFAKNNRGLRRKHGIETFPVGSQVALVVKNPPANAEDVKDTGSIPGLGRFPSRRQWQSTPVFLPGESRGQRNLAGYRPWDRKELDTTEAAERACSVVKNPPAGAGDIDLIPGSKKGPLEKEMTLASLPGKSHG